MERTLGDYEIHIAWEGFASIRHRSSGEIMHSRTPPMEEARRIYVEQSRLGERLRKGPRMVWDVGLGAAANAMAAIEVHGDSSQALRIVSFENDLDSLRLAMANIDSFPYLRHPAPREILEHGRWTDGGVTWDLVLGDFEETVTAAPGPPDVIFYDMYSSRTNPGPWLLDTLRKLRASCGNHPAELFTYTVSTAARAKMLAAGFHVARGRSAGIKHETTIALTPSAVTANPRELLGAEWLERWTRSAAKFPDDIAADDREAFERDIRDHPQFAHTCSSSL